MSLRRGSLARLTIRQMDLVGSRATIFTTPGRSIGGPTTQASDMDLAREEYNDNVVNEGKRACVVSGCVEKQMRL